MHTFVFAVQYVVRSFVVEALLEELNVGVALVKGILDVSETEDSELSKMET